MKGSSNMIEFKKDNGNGSNMQRTTIGIRMVTKSKLDKNRAPGQCYDGFLCQLVDLWEQIKSNEFNPNINKREVVSIKNN